MKKFAPLFIAAAALGSLQGCATDATDESLSLEDQAASCFNPEGTNAAIAALATTIAQELHRWQIAPIPASNGVPYVAGDFYKYRGYNNQEMLGLTSAGLAACGGDCFFTKTILAMQDSRQDLRVVFNGVKLSSWSFASRLVSGFDKQVACNSGKWCPFVPHVFGWKPDNTYTNVSVAPGACDTVFTFGVTKPAAQNHALLSAAEVNGLQNALVWTAANGPNPYIAFQSTASTVSIDPTGGVTDPSQTPGADLCQKTSRTDITGTACTCAANNIYANGALKKDDANPPLPGLYVCRQM